MMKTGELRGFSEEELQEKKADLKKRLFELNFKKKYGKVEAPHIFKSIRRDIARINTVLREKIDEEKKENP